MKTREEIGALLDGALARHPYLVLKALHQIINRVPRDIHDIQACKSALVRVMNAVKTVRDFSHPFTNEELRAAAELFRNGTDKQAYAERREHKRTYP